MGVGEALRAFSDKVDVRRLLQDEACGLDGVAQMFDAGDTAGFHAAAIHDEGVELDAAVGGEEAAAAGVEGGVVFKDGDGGFNGVDGGAAEGEDGVASFKGAADTGLVGGCGIGGNGPGAAVDEEGGVVSGWGCHGDYGRALGGTLNGVGEWLSRRRERAREGKRLKTREK